MAHGSHGTPTMGLLTELLDTNDVTQSHAEKSTWNTNFEEKKSPIHSPCEICKSVFFWRSVYQPDGEPLCVDCSPPPSRSLVSEWLGVFQDQSGIVRMLKVDARGRIIIPRSSYGDLEIRDEWQMIILDVSELIGNGEFVQIENRARGFCIRE